MEGSMTRFYPQYPMSAEGTEAFIRAFSMPGGFPSHVCPSDTSLVSYCSAKSAPEDART